MSVCRHVVSVGLRNSFRREFLHLICAHIHRLDKLPLEPALAAETLQISLLRANASYFPARGAASQRSGAGSAGLRIVYTEIGVVRQHIELVAQCPDYCAGQVIGSRRLHVME